MNQLHFLSCLFMFSLSFFYQELLHGESNVKPFFPLICKQDFMRDSMMTSWEWLFLLCELNLMPHFTRRKESFFTDFHVTYTVCKMVSKVYILKQVLHNEKKILLCVEQIRFVICSCRQCLKRLNGNVFTWLWCALPASWIGSTQYNPLADEISSTISGTSSNTFYHKQWKRPQNLMRGNNLIAS